VDRQPCRYRSAVLLDPVLYVDQTDGRREAIRHHRHLQREGEHVR
jgi:hypothetical protein